MSVSSDCPSTSTNYTRLTHNAKNKSVTKLLATDRHDLVREQTYKPASNGKKERDGLDFSVGLPLDTVFKQHSPESSDDEGEDYREVDEEAYTQTLLKWLKALAQHCPGTRIYLAAVNVVLRLGGEEVVVTVIKEMASLGITVDASVGSRVRTRTLELVCAYGCRVWRTLPTLAREVISKRPEYCDDLYREMTDDSLLTLYSLLTRGVCSQEAISALEKTYHKRTRRQLPHRSRRLARS